MTWTTTNPVSIGAATKKSHYDALWDNCDMFKTDHNTDGTHEKLTVGSDADGDMYYRASSVLTRLAKGTAGQILTMNSGATAPNWEGGTWTTPSFDAADFTKDAGTWTVAAGDVTTFAYLVIGKIMIVAFELRTTSVGGTASAVLQIKIPGSKTSTKFMATALGALYDNGVAAAGKCYVAAGDTIIYCTRLDGANLAAATDTTRIQGQIVFEIN